MAHVTFVLSDGHEQTVEAPDGSTVMQAALNNSVPGINGECCGSAACATCKVSIDPVWLAKIPDRDEVEESLLEDVESNVRLSCQIAMRPELDGLIVRVPESQYG